jgi:hypothetical protein
MSDKNSSSTAKDAVTKTVLELLEEDDEFEVIEDTSYKMPACRSTTKFLIIVKNCRNLRALTGITT